MTQMRLSPEVLCPDSDSLSAQPLMDAFAQSERLSIVANELNLLFADKIEGSGPFASLICACTPVLKVGRSIGLKLTIEIQACSGFFVLSENTPCETALVTASEQRLIDYIVGLVYGQSGERTPRTAFAFDAATLQANLKSLLVGGMHLIGPVSVAQ